MTTVAHGHEEHAHPVKLYYQPGLPIPNGKLFMWLFLSTEIMFFAALIGVLRCALRCARIAPRLI